MGGPPAGRRVRVLTLVDYLTEAGGAERLAAEITERLDPSRFSARCA